MNDLKSPCRAARSWENHHYPETRAKIRTLQKQVLRLKAKFTDMKFLVSKLKGKQIISDQVGEMISVYISNKIYASKYMHKYLYHVYVIYLCKFLSTKIS